MPKLKVYLAGGLGNQIFSYYFGFWLSHSQKNELKVIYDDQSILGINHGLGLQYFELPYGEFELGKSKQIRLREILLNLAWKISQKKKNHLAQKVFSIFGSTDTWTRDFPMIEYKVRRVFGQYHSNLFVDWLVDQDKNWRIKLVDESSWYRDKSRLIQEIDPTVVHIRRGDYEQKIPESLLPVTYFQKALREMSTECQRKPIWVFTDDEDAAKKLTLGLDIIIIDSKESNEAENLMVMSLAKRIIISNSTYSLWAAKLGQPNYVAYPDPWFVGRDVPENFFPSEWKPIKWT